MNSTQFRYIAFWSALLLSVPVAFSQTFPTGLGMPSSSGSSTSNTSQPSGGTQGPSYFGVQNPVAAPGLGQSTTATPGQQALNDEGLRRRIAEMQKAGMKPEEIAQILQKEADANAVASASEERLKAAQEAALAAQAAGNQPAPPPAPVAPVASEGVMVDQSRIFAGEVEIGISEDSTYVIVEEYNDIGEKRQRKKPLTKQALEARRVADARRKQEEYLKNVSKIFGQSLFSDATFAEMVIKDTTVVSPPDNYIIGPGDKFAITIWGPVELYESLLVAEDGAIARQFLGKVYLAGRTFAEARQILTQRYKSIIDPSAHFEVTITPQRRVIGVNIVGEIAKPGKYMIPAMMSAFTAMFAAKGINEIGSVRNIQIKREGKTIQTLDVYDYLLSGNISPIYLKQEDFIFVPSQGRVVQILGAVHRQSRYELKDAETLKDLVRFAGGLYYDAKTTEVKLRRFVEDKEQIFNFNMAEAIAADFKLLDGDVIAVTAINRGLRNQLSATGAVHYPNEYEIVKNDRVSDLIDRAGGLQEDVYLDRAYVRRRISPVEFRYIPISLTNVYSADGVLANKADTNNIVLESYDQLTVYSKQDFFTKRNLRITGAVNRPSVVVLMPTMTLKDVLFMVGGPKETADLENIVLSSAPMPEELDAPSLLSDTASAPTDTTGRQVVRRISIAADWKNDPKLDTMLLRGYTNIQFYSKYDFAFPEKISIAGAVRRARSTPLYQGMTLRDLLYLAGGPNQNLDGQTLELYKRIDPRKTGLAGLSTKEQTIYRITIGRDWQTDARLDTLIVTPFEKVVLRSPMEFFRPGTVSLKGLVARPDEYAVTPNMTLKDLFYMAGGLELNTNFNKIEITRILDDAAVPGDITLRPAYEIDIAVRQNWRTDARLDTVIIHPYDQVFVRPDPAFRLQESIFIEGEALVPGEYTKLQKDERIASLVGRAGGITDVAYLGGAYIVRNGIGIVSMRLDKALNRPRSRHNFSLLVGDRLVIPAESNIIKVKGNVWSDSTTLVFDENRKKLHYYTDLSGGFKKKTSRKDITVKYVDGRVKRAHNYLFFTSYPKMEQGATITVPMRDNTGLRGLDNLNVNLANGIREVTKTITSIVPLLLIARTLR